MSTLERVTARRTWLLHDFAVWGIPTLGELDLLLAEFPSSSGELFYSKADIGDSAQTVEFSHLTDHRGNPLPDTINTPHIIVRPRSSAAAFLVGRETDHSFRIAHDPAVDGPVIVDLLITEMGE